MSMGEDLAQRLEAILLVAPDPLLMYYAISLLGTESGVVWSCISHWEDFTKEKPPREIRAGSLIDAARVAEIWRAMGQSYVVVNSLDDMVIFMLLGGHALVEQVVARDLVPEMLAPHPVAPVGAFGYRDIESLPQGALNRAPTPGLRMRILKRDDYRCRICGRRSADHVDVELHVHHIRPWAQGGVTEESNLVTLCHTCHNGLRPHFEFGLFDLCSSRGKAIDPQLGLERYQEGVARYRRLAVEVREKHRP